MAVDDDKLRRNGLDPTERTLEQSRRDVQALREIIEARLDGMDRAVALIQSRADRIPSDVDDRVARQAETLEERFAAIALRFTERDKRSEQNYINNREQIGAALLAQKEAAAKTEGSFAEQIRGIDALLTNTTAALTDKIDDLRNRVGAVENQKKGVSDSFGTIALVITVAVGLTVLFTFFGSQREPATPVATERLSGLEGRLDRFLESQRSAPAPAPLPNQP